MRGQKLVSLRLFIAVLTIALSAAPSIAFAQTEPPLIARPQITGPHAACPGVVDEGEDIMTVSGTATPGATLTKAIVRQFKADGSALAFERNVMSQDLGAGRVQLSADGNFSGSITSVLDPAATSFALVVTVTKGAETVTEGSNELTIDRIVPTIDQIKTTSATTMIATFSEDVFLPGNTSDSPLDWNRRGDPTQRPSSVSGAGATRTLTFGGMNFTEDELPEISYFPPATRPTYKDCVNHDVVHTTSAPFTRNAVDRFLPRVPVIQSIDGQGVGTDNRAAGQATSFDVIVGTATNGHTIKLWRESNGVSGLQPSGDTVQGEATVAGGTVTIPAAPGGPDGEYTFYARATDIHGNPSDSADEAIYRLDTSAPTALRAVSNNSKVTVAFNEPLETGGNNTADWTVESTGVGGITVTHQVTSVSGTGDVRDLQVSGVPNGARVSYTPPASNPYKNEAGLALAAFGPITVEGLIPSTIDLTPEDVLVAVTDNHTVTVSVKDDFGTLVPGGDVVLRAVSGPSATRNVDGSASTPVGVIGTCSSQANGTCTFVYTSSTTGTDVLQAWLGSPNTPPSAEPRDETGADQKGQDVGQVTWTVQNADLSLDVSPENSSGPLNSPFTPTIDVESVGGASPGSKVEGVNVDARVIGGPNNGTRIGDCTTGAQGTCALNPTSTVTGTDTIQFWIDANNDNSSAGELDGGSNEAVDPSADPSPLAPPDDPVQDVVTHTWTAATVQYLNLEPEVSTGRIGEARSMTFSVINQNGDAIQGLNVDARVLSGPNAGTSVGECTTDVLGECRLTYTSNAKGTDAIQAWIDTNGDDVPGEATVLEARSEAPTQDENDQDVIEATWTASSDTLFLNTTPEKGLHNVGTSAPLSLKVIDGTDVVRANEDVAARVVSGPSKDRDIDSNTATPAGFIGRCTTGATGTCSVTYGSTVKGSDVVLTWLDADHNGESNEVSAAEPATESTGNDVPGHDVVEVTWVAEDAPTRLLSLDTSSDSSALRAPVTLSGVLDVSGSCPAATISIERKRPGRDFTAWRSKDPSSDGTWSLTFRPTQTASYRASVGATGDCAALSEVVLVEVGSKVFARLIDDQIRTGECAVVRGNVAPRKAGKTVTLQLQKASGFQRVATTTVGRQSLYRFETCPTGAGTKVYRVRFEGDAKNLGSTSSLLNLRVR
ncbi:MAG: large repetitive protein [Actinomycetota bacterium]|nr:large repetitive protein [Actinomycetota bacterium]